MEGSQDGIGSWGILIGAILFGSAGMIKVVFETLQQWFPVWFAKKVSRRTYGEQMATYAEFTEEVEALGRIPCVDQAIVFRGHNCGKLPTPGKPYTIHAIQGWRRCADGKCEDPTERYKRGLQVDAHYARMLEDMVKQGVSIQELSKMPQDAKLRGYFLRDKIKHCILYYLGHHDDELIFVSVATCQEVGFEPMQVVDIEDRVTAMRGLIGSP